MTTANSQGVTQSLFIEDFYEALKGAVAHLGGAKQVGAKLWPHKPMEQARKELLDALNRDNPRKLDPEEVMALLRMAREGGYHATKHWMDQELGYSPGMPIEPEDELAMMLREYLLSRQRESKLAEKIDAQLNNMGVRVVK